ncbi:MAG: hypothetical protein M0R80_00655 [Proteobacteria bacterium]|jgi:hypothetical protein|nr:hypothetical protein [Pseudomonadota bacterium]
MNKYLVKFDVWVSVCKDAFLRKHCAMMVFADTGEEAQEKAQNLARLVVYPNFHHFDGEIGWTQIIDTVEKAVEVFGDPNFVSKAVVEKMCEPEGLGVVRVMDP